MRDLVAEVRDRSVARVHYTDDEVRQALIRTIQDMADDELPPGWADAVVMLAAEHIKEKETLP